MAITMQGPWTVGVKSKSAGFAQRFVIAGSSNSADGTYGYSGGNPPPPVAVQGAQWTVAVQHRPGSNKPWQNSDERIGTPSVTGSTVSLDIRSNDSGSDEDYNDLVLECTSVLSDLDHVVYGNVKTYKGFCRFSPCWGPFVVLETSKLLQYALADRAMRSVLKRFYPERVGRFERPELGTEFAPRGGFTPLMLPISESAGTTTATAKAVLGSRIATASDYAIIQKFKDLFTVQPCTTRVEPEQLLRFIEYDRTAGELAGGPYTGTGGRETLGLTVTDEVGNYVFRFRRTLADVVTEGTDEVPDGPAADVQLRPDLIVQVIEPGMGSTEFLYETGLFSDIPQLKRINLCFPESDLRGVTCGTGRVFERIGDVWVLPGVSNTFDSAGRITVNDGRADFTIERAAWTGTLRLMGCFSELKPNPVAHYTIRYRRGSGSWNFVTEEEFRTNKSGLSLPWNAPINRIGPTMRSLHVDGGAKQNVPAYDNIETDSDWAASTRYMKLKMNSGIYAAVGNPGTVTIRIDGYDTSGSLVPNSSDTLTLYIDNDPATGGIDSIALGSLSPGECALFELPAATAPLTVTFDADQPNGHLQSYELKVWRGSSTPVPVTSSFPLAKSYQAAMGASFRGTVDVPGNTLGSLVADVTPAGTWLPVGKNFCAFAFELWTRRRATDGRDRASARREHIELIGLSYSP